MNLNIQKVGGKYKWRAVCDYFIEEKSWLLPMHCLLEGEGWTGDNLSKIKEVKDIKVDSIYTANTLDEEIENVALRAKLIDFDLKSVSDMFEELMRSIENQWVDINERISTIFEDLPIMRDGSKASEPESPNIFWL